MSKFEVGVDMDTHYIPMEDDTTMQRFTTDRDAKNEILSALAASHGTWDDEAVDAIFREAYEWKIDTNDVGAQLLNTAGFEQIVSADEFWAIVAKHDKSV